MLALVKEQEKLTASEELWQVAETDNTERLAEILAKGVDVNISNEDGVTALMRAALNGRSKMVAALISQGADLNARRVDGFTPLLLAVFFGHAETVKLLVERGADISLVTRFGTSAEMWATARSFQEIARYLEGARKGINNAQKIRSQDTNKANSQSAIRQSRASRALANAVPARTVDRSKKSSETFAEPAPGNLETPNAALNVRTLKEPPDIWDLVPEARVHFKPGQTFIARISSNKAKFGLAGVFMIAVSIVGWALVSERAGKSALTVELPKLQDNRPIESNDGESVGESDRPDSATTHPQPQMGSESNITVPGGTQLSNEPSALSVQSAGPKRITLSNKWQVRGKATSRSRPRSQADHQPLEQNSTSTSEVQPIATTKPRPHDKSDMTADSKPGNSVSSTQLIAPARTTRGKPKVIQWP